MRNPSPVILLGLFPTSIHAARIFRRRGVPVVGYDCDPRQPGFHSRLIRARACPDPAGRPEALAAFLREEILRLPARPLLIPSSDEYTDFLNRRREEFSDISHFLLPTRDRLHRLLDKKHQFEAAEKAGLRVPETLCPDTIDDLDGQAGRIAYPVFVKARRSYTWKKHFLDKGFPVHGPDALLKTGRMLFDKGIDFLVQRIVLGGSEKNIEVNLLRLDSGTVYSHTIRKMRQYPVDFGTATSVRTESVPTLEAAANRFVRQTELTGFSNTEFKWDENARSYFFVETNARIWLQVDLCEYVEHNLLVIAYNHVTGEMLPQHPPRGRKTVYWIDVPNDLFSLTRQPCVRPPDFMRWLVHAARAKSHGTFYWRDPLPFFLYVISSLKRMLLKPFRKHASK